MKKLQTHQMMMIPHPLLRALPPAATGEEEAAAVGEILHRHPAVGVLLQLQAQGPQHHLQGANSAGDSTPGTLVLIAQVGEMMVHHRG